MICPDRLSTWNILSPAKDPGDRLALPAVPGTAGCICPDCAAGRPRGPRRRRQPRIQPPALPPASGAVAVVRLVHRRRFRYGPGTFQMSLRLRTHATNELLPQMAGADSTVILPNGYDRSGHTTPKKFGLQRGFRGVTPVRVSATSCCEQAQGAGGFITLSSPAWVGFPAFVIPWSRVGTAVARRLCLPKTTSGRPNGAIRTLSVPTAATYPDRHSCVTSP